jgi:cell division septation protein DedD
MRREAAVRRVWTRENREDKGLRMAQGKLASIKRIAGAALVLAGVVAWPARANVKDGVDAWSRGDYARAVGHWREPAEQGDADALFNLGQAYKLGKGVPQDLAEAEELFRRAAEKGHLQASDNYGLLLFQGGKRSQAMPYVRAAADRGDARAQYLLGLAHFNGDLAEKDWVRGYALVSLAQQAGLAQARTALAQMDQHIPIEQRQQAVALASQLAAEAEANKARQLAVQDLGTGTAPVTAKPAKPAATPPKPLAAAPKVPPAKPATTPATASGPWKVQLGAFGVAANADALWNRLKNRPELAGHARINARAGAVTKLQAGGFASQAEAAAACRKLAAADHSCLATRD